MPDPTPHAAELSRKRCFHHASREAAARCLECERYFCRECVTEHAGRVICAQCLKQLPPPASSGHRLVVGILRCAAGALGLLVAWMFFYYLGEVLLSISTSFHEGNLWGR